METRKSFKWMGKIFAFLALGGPGVLLGQTANYTLLQPLDNQGGSARAAAMGSAFVAVADDSSALLWNPAGLGKIQEGELALHHNSWLADTLQESLVGGIPIGDMGGIGAMVSYLDYGSFSGRDSNGTITSNYTANKLGFMAGWGREWARGFSAGIALRGGLQSSMGNSYGLFSGDIGLLYNPDPQLKLGAALVNFGGNQSGGWVASAVRVGFSYKPKMNGPHGLLMAVGGTVEPQGVNRAGFGVEYSFQSKYFLRAGYQLFEQNNEIQGLQGLTAGAGIQWNGFELDYAYLPYGDLGTSNRVSLSYLFPAESPGSKPAPAAKAIPPSAARADSSPVGEPPVGFKPEPGSGMDKKPLTLQFDVPADLVAQGKALEEQGHRAEAMDLYEEEIKKDPQDAAAWSALGNNYFKMLNKPETIRCFEQVLKLRPDNKAIADWLEKYKADQ